MQTGARAITNLARPFRNQKQYPAFADCPAAGLSLVSKGEHLSETNLKFPKWQTPFQEALLEFDVDKLADKIQEVEALVLVRLQELASDADHHEERQAIDDALCTLRLLKNEKLAYPDWKRKPRLALPGDP